MNRFNSFFILFLITNLSFGDEGQIILNADDDEQPIINFEYLSPIKGIKFSGSYKPSMLFDCQNQFTGNGILTLTRLSDNKTIQLEEGFGLRAEDVCTEAEYPLCNLKSNITIQHGETSKLSSEDFLENESDIKLFDYDFDDQDELLVRNPCGTRGGNDYVAYELNNEADNFSIGKSLFLYAGTTFNPENKTMTTGGSGGACSSEYITYKSDGEGYVPISAVRYRNDSIYNEIDGYPIANGCVEERYEFDKLQNRFIFREVKLLR